MKEKTMKITSLTFGIFGFISLVLSIIFFLKLNPMNTISDPLYIPKFNSFYFQLFSIISFVCLTEAIYFLLNITNLIDNEWCYIKIVSVFMGIFIFFFSFVMSIFLIFGIVYLIHNLKIFGIIIGIIILICLWFYINKKVIE